eukprot:scaffold83108_cov75-Phaeocystis_antarctica.AAC.1
MSARFTSCEPPHPPCGSAPSLKPLTQRSSVPQPCPEKLTGNPTPNQGWQRGARDSRLPWRHHDAAKAAPRQADLVRASARRHHEGARSGSDAGQHAVWPAILPLLHMERGGRARRGRVRSRVQLRSRGELRASARERHWLGRVAHPAAAGQPARAAAPAAWREAAPAVHRPLPPGDDQPCEGRLLLGRRARHPYRRLGGDLHHHQGGRQDGILPAQH